VALFMDYAPPMIRSPGAERPIMTTRITALLIAAAALLSATARANTILDVAYMPIMPVAQLFVVESEGWAKQAGLDLKLTKFDSGPAITTAIASGKFDVMYFGIGPALVARAGGVPIKVVASNVVEQIALIAQGDLAKLGASGAAAAITGFTQSKGHKPKIATLPKGSVPDLVLRHWLVKIAHLPADAVEIVPMGEDKVQSALLTRAVDGASILEPIVTIVRERMPDAAILVSGGQMFKDQPGAVLAVRESALAVKRDAIEKLVALHVRATELLTADPKRAAQDVYPFMGAGLVELGTIEQAIRSPISHFRADPRAIQPATKEMLDFSAEIGVLDKPVDLSQLFDISLYEQAVTAK
jgi:NitT/TauT family transport system substrate-binding protein